MQNLIIGADYRAFKHILECCMTTKQAIFALSRTCPAQEFKFLLLRHAEPGADTRSELFSYFRLRYPRKSRHLSPSLQSLKGLLFRLLSGRCFLLAAHHFDPSFLLWKKETCGKRRNFPNTGSERFAASNPAYFQNASAA